MTTTTLLFVLMALGVFYTLILFWPKLSRARSVRRSYRRLPKN